MNYQNIIKATDLYYTSKIKQYGKTNWGVDWNSIDSMELRYKQLSLIFANSVQNDNNISVCDFGCGYGYYHDYLRSHKYNYKYIGIDVSEAMIECAKSTSEDANCTFINSCALSEKYNYIIASGIFNVRQDADNVTWFQYMKNIIDMFNEHTLDSGASGGGGGFAFNCLTKYSDREYMKDYLYYADPLFWFDYCKKECSRNVDLLHGYNLYEFTILVYK